MQRDYDRDDARRRSQPGQADDDPRDNPRERYGNEEDQYSREHRRIYGERNLPQRLHDDSAYDRRGYEPEAGRPGGRENVDLDRERPRGGGRGQPQGRYEEQWRHQYGGDPYGYDWERPAGRPGSRGQRHAFETSGEDWTDDDSPQGGFPGQHGIYGQGGQRQRFGQGGSQQYRQGGGPRPRYGQPGYERASSPYDQGDISSWYGGDTGMGDYGASQPGRQSGGPYRSHQGSQFGSQYGDQGHGPFSGRGPRGYQRSDDRIREDVCELLTRHGEIDASGMEVDVQRGTVILRGMADSGRTRRLTEELVEDVPGVHDVENQLRVNQRTGYSSTSTDATGSGGASAGDRGGNRMGNVPAYGVGVAETSGVSTRSGPGEPGMSAGAGRSQHGNPWQIHETMDVIGSDGESVGTVKSVRGTDFQLDRPMARDLYVPFSAVRTVDGERVLLGCRAGEVDQQNWPTADLTGASEAPPAR